jgi:hypothetical protein
MSKRKYEEFNKDTFISATRLCNYVRNDPIIDYLDLVDVNGLEVDSSSLNLVNKKNKNKKRKTAFDYIVEEGYKFEEKIVKKIISTMNKLGLGNEVITIEKNSDLEIQFEKTQEIITQGLHQVIFGGLLINKKNGTYGYPDMIVSGQWIEQFVYSIPKKINENIYYIIDIKSSTINLISKGKYVCSGNLLQGYKSQIWVYKEALDLIQGCESNFGFILGKKYKYVEDNKEINICDSFYTLGTIDYEYEKNKGNNIKNQVSKSIKWNREIREKWKQYKLYPINNKIRPNMKNFYDKNYKKIKKIIATKNNELTLLWNCGMAGRTHASKYKITKFTDKRLTANKINVKDSSLKYNITNLMIKMIHENKPIHLKSDSNYGNWRKVYTHEFFVDFETYLQVYDEALINENFNFDTNEFVPSAGTVKQENNLESPSKAKLTNIELSQSEHLYMIGVGYLSEKKEFDFKCFIIDYHGSNRVYEYVKEIYNCKKSDIVIVPDEKTLIENFINYIYSYKNPTQPKHKFLSETRLIHWSPAEPNIITKKLVKYKLFNGQYLLPWFDLMYVFKNNSNPILIKNCFSFSLKDITKSLHSHKLINLEWSDLDDGLLSAFIAKDIYRNNSNEKTNNQNMEDIIEYNYIDCKALYLILTFLREYKENN